MTSTFHETLPLDEAWPELKAALETHQNLVLVAEPGAGKTTRFPASLLNSELIARDKNILVLEPRRLAAKAAAARIGDEQNWRLGEEVGYQVRFDNRVSPQTRLQFLTEGLLARRLLADPELKNTGAIILDEFHERSRHTDIALSMLFELQELARPDLKIIVMSATIDAENVSRFLKNCPIVKVPGRTHPITIHHARTPLALDTGPRFFDTVTEKILEVLRNENERSGDILVFLPGTREIRRIKSLIEGPALRAGFICHELHGSLSLEDQDKAIRKQESGQGKIVLATNIAETSLTIDGVGTVIDSGLARVMRLDGDTGLERLQLSRISLASATQRAGRAGRQGPGHCHRLWTKFDETSMAAFEEPELKRTDLSETILFLLSQGIRDPHGFSWFESPPSAAISLALDTLTDLGFRDSQTGALTDLGREALKLPLAPRLARLVLEAARIDQLELGARIAALISEKDIISRDFDVKKHVRIESDVISRLDLIERKAPEIDRFSARNVERVAQAIIDAARRIPASQLGRSPLPRGKYEEHELAQILLLLAFPDRVCRRRRPKEPQARMVGGRGVTLSHRSSAETAMYFVAIDSQGGDLGPKSDATISSASAIEREWLEIYFPEVISKQSRIVFDETTLSVQSQTARFFRDLPLEEPHIGRPDAEAAYEPLLQAALDRWETHISRSDSLERWLARLEFIRKHFPDETEFDFDTMKRSALEEAAYGETKLSDLLRKPLNEIFSRHLPASLAYLIDEASPDTLTVPSGSRIRLHYPSDRDPYLEVRIQEVFGLKRSPLVARGRVPVVLHLLGPNYRPVQVTSDLGSFWKNGYIEVRKELRARYPKHAWPEDPLTATPEAKGRRRT